MTSVIMHLKKRKEELGLTNKQLSSLSGVPYGTVCRVLSKMDGTPNLQTLKDLAQALDVSIDEAIGMTPGNENTEQIAEQGSSSAPGTSSPDEGKVDAKYVKNVVDSYEALLEERQKLLDEKSLVINSKEKWLFRLFITCCVLVGIIVAVLVFDLINPSIGFFRH